jgi:heptosyltransferase-1
MIQRAFPAQFVPALTPCNVSVSRCPVPFEHASRRIVIMRAGAHGDILMGTPLLSAIRREYPAAHITWIVEHTECDAINANPHIDDYILWNSKHWKRMVRRCNAPMWIFHALRLLKELRRRRYDTFISFQPEEWPLLARGIAAPLSIGVFDTFRRFYGADRASPNMRLYRHAYAHPNLPAHRIDQYLLALEALGIRGPVSKHMTMGYSAEDDAAAHCRLEEWKIGRGVPYAVLAPLTTWPTKCWPAERYAALGDILSSRYGMPIVLIGTKKEAPAIEAIAAGMASNPVVAAGALTFRQMAAVIDHASVLVSGDTGPMHVAAAVDTPYVALFGATSADWYGPQGGGGVHLAVPVPCGPCDKKRCSNPPDTRMMCMATLTVDRVAEAVFAQLRAAPRMSNPAQTRVGLSY